MTIKELAYSAQQQLQSRTEASFKRAHVYELLAASFGFKSHAALSVDTVLRELGPNDKTPVQQSALVGQRCIELGYQPDIATPATSVLESFLAERRIGIISISSLIRQLRGSSFDHEQYHDDDEDHGEDEDEADEPFADPFDRSFGTILLAGLNAAASQGNARANYALALIHDPVEEDDDGQDTGSSYWYEQRQAGRTLTGVEKEWADAHESRLAQADRYSGYLKAAGRLGHPEALVDLAERFDDPSFFEQSLADVDADPAAIADIAERMHRSADAKLWLTVAAETGDMDAMRRLVEEYDHDDLLRCWTWVHFSRLLGEDLTEDAHYAINEDGSDYDDDVGGPAFVDGRDGVDLESPTPQQDATARLAAKKLFEKIKRNSW